MRKSRLLNLMVAGWMLLTLGTFAKAVFADPDALVASGKEKLFRVDAEGNPDGDLIGANADFSAALVENSGHPQANFWYGLTRIGARMQSQDTVDILTDFGFTKTDGSTLDVAALNPFNPDIKSASALPTDCPTATDVQDFFKATILAEIDAALSENFSLLDEATFTDTVDFGDGTKELDGGEVLACKAFLNFLSAMMHSGAAYDADGLDIDALIADTTFSINDDILIPYPDLLKPIAAEASTQLAAAKSALEAMLNNALDGIDFVQSETDDQSNDLITIDSADAEGVNLVKDVLNFFLSSLSGSANITLTPPDGDELAMQLTLNLSEFFDGENPIDLRGLLPQFSAENEIVRSSFPDPTMGGVFPNMTQADLNHLCGFGPELVEVKVNWLAGEPSVELNWEQENALDFGYYRIYRTTPDDPTSWVQIGSDITNPANTTLTDNTVDETAYRVYYYRLHTYYTSETDSTYSDTERAVLVVYVDVNSASTDEDGSKANPFKDLGDAIDDYTTNGTKVCVAAGTYHESDVSLHMWGINGLVLEGGYESAGWTRDIQANETIIDGTGLGGWNVVQFSQVDGGTIDGFTVTGGHMQEWSCGIGVWQASSVTIKNCKVINNNAGVGIWNGSQAVVEDCDIAQNLHQGLGINGASSATVENCRIAINTERGIGIWEDSSVLIRNCTVSENSNRGIDVNNSPNKAYSVYGGDTYLSGPDGYHPQDFGYTFLGDDRITRTYYGTYDYYIIVTEAGNPVKVDTVQGSDLTYYATNTTGNTQNWGNVGGAPDGAYATVGLVDAGGFILIDPTAGNTSLKVYIVDEPLSGQVEIRDSVVENNAGGGINFAYASGLIKNNLIVDNPGSSGVFCDRAGSVSIENNTISGNGGNGGIYCQINSSPVIKNNIIVNNNRGPGHFGIYCDETSNPVISYNDVFGNDSGNYYNCTAGTGDISQDPLFTEGPNGPYYLSQTVSYQSVDSPCLNAGSDTAVNLGFDATRTTRTDCQPDADTVDLGYHYPAEIFAHSPLVLNEFLPNPTGNDSGEEWVELYNPGSRPINLSGYVIDDIIGGGSAPQRIPTGTIIEAYGFYVMDLPGSYLNNDGDTVNLLWPDGETVIDSHAYTSTTEGGSDYRCPDGGPWAGGLDFTPTKNSWNCPITPPFLSADLDGNGEDDIVIDFGDPYGIWIWFNNSTWTKLHDLSPEYMVKGDLDGSGQDELIIDFGDPYGIWIWFNNSSWNKLHELSPGRPERMLTADIDNDGYDEIIIDFGEPYGIWIYSAQTATWSNLHSLSCDYMLKADLDADAKDDIIIDFGDPYGIWIWSNNSGWLKLHGLTPERMLTADIDNDGYDEIAIDFGDPYGIWVYYPQLGVWGKLHSLSCDYIVKADLDADLRDDLVIDFGDPLGIWIWSNNSSWIKLHELSSDWMITGDMDNTGQDEAIIDFGDPYGIWVWFNNSGWLKLHDLSP